MPLELSNPPFSTSWKTTPLQNVPTGFESFEAKSTCRITKYNPNNRLERRDLDTKTEFAQQRTKSEYSNIELISETSCLITRRNEEY